MLRVMYVVKNSKKQFGRKCEDDHLAPKGRNKTKLIQEQSDFESIFVNGDLHKESYVLKKYHV